MSVWFDSDASSSKNLGTPPYNERVLSNHVLAFIKAFRLCGDRFSLCQAVVEKSSDSDLLEAMQVLWDHCHDSLEKLGVEFVRRRGSDKRSLLDAVLADILDVLDKLDVDDTIPLIFCEASDLLKLNRDAVLSSPKSLSEELQGKVSRSDGVADRLKQKLGTMQADMKCAVTFAITSLSSDLSSFSKEACSISIVFL